MNDKIFFFNKDKLNTFGTPIFNLNDIEQPIFNNKIYVNKSGIHGWGVFAKKEIKKGELIERSPVIIEEQYHLGYNSWGNKIYYQFSWEVPRENDNCLYATALGYGSIYNHSDRPNANWAFYTSDVKLILFYATRNIRKDEEIFIWYGDLDPKQIKCE